MARVGGQSKVLMAVDAVSCGATAPRPREREALWDVVSAAIKARVPFEEEDFRRLRKRRGFRDEDDPKGARGKAWYMEAVEYRNPSARNAIEKWLGNKPELDEIKGVKGRVVEVDLKRSADCPFSWGSGAGLINQCYDCEECERRTPGECPLLRKNGGPVTVKAKGD